MRGMIYQGLRRMGLKQTGAGVMQAPLIRRCIREETHQRGGGGEASRLTKSSRKLRAS